MSQSYGPKMTTDGLAVYFDPSNPKNSWGFDAKNQIGPSYNGTYNAVGFQSDPPRYQSTATTITELARIVISPDKTFDDNDPWSFCFFCKLNSGAQQTFHSLAGRHLTTQWMILYLATSFGNSWNLRWCENDGTYHSCPTQTTDIIDDWHFCAFRMDSSRNLTMSVNDTHYTPIAVSNSAMNATEIMGGYHAGSNNYPFQGSIGLCAIYDRFVTDEETETIMESFKKRFGL